jgi:hypothetical protein
MEKARGTHWLGGWVGSQSVYGHGDEEKNSQPLPSLEPPIIQPVAQRYTTELSRVPPTLHNFLNLGTVLVSENATYRS